jgi:hypothetical protein
MASLPRTLPYIYLDPSLHLLDIYHIQVDKHFDWPGLFDKAVNQQQDLSPLKSSIALLLVVYKHKQKDTEFEGN